MEKTYGIITVKTKNNLLSIRTDKIVLVKVTSNTSKENKNCSVVYLYLEQGSVIEIDCSNEMAGKILAYHNDYPNSLCKIEATNFSIKV